MAKKINFRERLRRLRARLVERAGSEDAGQLLEPPWRASKSGGHELGMTLIEIMVVVAIIGLLMGTVGVVAYKRYKKAQITNTKQIIKNLETAVETYMMDNNGDCPKDLKDLYVKKIINRDPRDAWGQELIYKCPGDNNKDTADVLSKGPDKREGTEDDLKNWSSGERR